MIGLLFVFLAANVFAADIPDSWRCDKKKESRFWEGLKHVDAKTGPAWGEDLYDKLPTPFAWLVLYENRDKDIAERRAPLNRRWAEFEPGEKCAYFRQYHDRILERKAEFDRLVAWKEEGKIVKRLEKLVGGAEDVVAAQQEELLTEWRGRFQKMLDWLEIFGFEDEEGAVERARGVFIRIARLKAAYLAFQQESGWFESRVRLRLAEFQAGASGKFPMLREPGVDARVVADLAEQLSKDWRNPRILGDQFEFRVSEVLRAILRERKAAAQTEKVMEVRRVITEKKLSRKKAMRLIDGIEKDLKKGDIVFPAGAEAELLLSLEEYRRGRTDLYPLAEEGRPREELVRAYLEMLRGVCVTHYTSIRYKKRVIKTLCGP